jgi:two-component system sensor histidine kinase RpfC
MSESERRRHNNDGIFKSESFGLILAAKQLRNERLVRIFESFLEYRACVGRVIIQAIIVIWTGAWLYGPQPVLVQDAERVFPASIFLLALAVIWMLIVRRRVIPSSAWLDATGFALNFIFIGIQTYLAFLLLISLNAFLPFIAIAAAARYGRTAIKPVISLAFILLLMAAPAGYWISRPAYFVYAFALTVLLPLLFARIVIAMQEIAYQAIDSRNAQSRFISTMSHELRTPLNAIINCAILIDTESMQSEQKDMMKAVSVNAAALRHRVNDVLDVASIEGGKLVLDRKSVKMADVMATVQAVCGNAASAKGVTLGFKLESPEPLYFEGDEGRIEQVVTNLVSNAIKFTPSGGTVDLHITAEPMEDHWDVLVKVTDSGIGVPDDKKEAIFAPFTQLSSGSARVEGGVGLGLYIAKSVSNAMHGKLSLYNNPSGGSIFDWQFSAPRSACDHRRLLDLRETLELHKASVQSMRFLVFEDMEVNRLVVGSLLTRAGHEVQFQTDGYHVVERIRAANADVVFLDLHMPGKSGWDVLQDIADTIATLPPIIVLTADTRSDSIRDAMAIGVAGYLAKPINAQEMLGVIKECHDLGRRHG